MVRCAEDYLKKVMQLGIEERDVITLLRLVEKFAGRNRSKDATSRLAEYEGSASSTAARSSSAPNGSSAAASSASGSV
jgi:hypothetical protein